MSATIHLIVKDGEKYIRRCLEAASKQSFDFARDKDYEVLVFDNNSSDKTREIVEKEFPRAKLIKFDKNYGLGGGFNRSLEYSNSKYVVLLCVDIILAPNFLSEAIRIMEGDEKIGALQPKILRWDFENNALTDIIDTTGFQIFKSRRIINRGHGEKDKNQYAEGEIFSYEGACPIFKREALLAASYWPLPTSQNLEPRSQKPELLDEDFGWYADDIDFGWRMRLFGWKSYFSPKVIAWHDRQTTKSLKKNFIDFIRIRQGLPWRKRMLDWRNQRLTMIKNEIPANFLKNLPHFLKREIPLDIYFFFFEPETLWLGIFGFFKLLPKIIKKRKFIMAQRKISANEIEKWFA